MWSKDLESRERNRPLLYLKNCCKIESACAFIEPPTVYFAPDEKKSDVLTCWRVESPGEPKVKRHVTRSRRDDTHPFASEKVRRREDREGKNTMTYTQTNLE